MSTRYRLSFLLALLGVVLLSAAGSARAQTAPVSWSVQPATAAGGDSRAAFTYALKPGSTQNDFVAITNLSETPLTLRVYASDAFNTPGGGFDLLAAGKPSIDVGTWVKIQGDSVPVPARGRVVLPFTLTVPENATPGDHVAGIVASIAAATRDKSGGQVAIDYRVGSRVYLRVDGVLSPRMGVDGAHLSYAGNSSPVGKGALDMSYAVSNDGNVRFASSQRAIVRGPFGIKLSEQNLDDLPELLPGSVYQVHSSVKGVLPVLWLRSEVVLQPHAADGSAIEGLDARTFSSSTWAIPTTQLAILAGVCLLLAAYVAFKRRGRRSFLAIPPADLRPQ